MKLVSLELAKFLKNNGYDKPCNYYYQDKELSYSPKGLKSSFKKKLNHNKYDEFIYSAPFQEDANKWLLKNNFKLIN